MEDLSKIAAVRDILGIFEHYQLEALELIIIDYNPKDVADITDYLAETGLMTCDKIIKKPKNTC